ncbi:unnamed protein product [Peniophora sp. CBMAI 1063]|nr:unnamed protein product [Peniophora sp. CBMAI 1063]
MARVNNVTNTHHTTTAPVLDALVVVYGNRKVAIRRVANYQATVTSIKRSVRALAQVATPSIIIKCNTLPEQDGEYIEISEDAWPDLIFRSYLKKVEVEVDTSSLAHAVPGDTLDRSRQPGTSTQKAMNISVVSITGMPLLKCKVNPTTRAGGILSAIASKLDGGLCVSDIALVYGNINAREEDTMAVLGVKDGDSVAYRLRMLGGKPVIYLQPPSAGSAVDATVRLSLSESWSLSALYPIRPGSTYVDSSYGQETSWAVRADSNGMLYDKATESEVSYLYWEARTNLPPPLTPPTSPSLTPSAVAFDPSRAEVSASDSVLLPVDKIPGYLDRVLAALSLHTEARTSFITYWLPSMLKHAHVALRFVPQSDYEHAARLTVTPAPDIVTRVFMLFRGVEEGEMANWTAAVDRADEDVEFWKGVVGVDVALAQDASLFRVLEWGGMEVLTR